MERRPITETTRKGAIVLWCLASGTTMYLFTLAMEGTEEWYNHYLLFLLTYSLGGLGFHGLMELCTVELCEQTEAQWRKMASLLAKALGGYVIALIFFAIGKFVGGAQGYLLAYFGFFLGMAIVFKYMSPSIDLFFEMKNKGMGHK